jgi:hypothetical protein
MDWVLLLRSEADMWNIINASVDRNTVEAQVFFGENRNVLYGVSKSADSKTGGGALGGSVPALRPPTAVNHATPRAPPPANELRS